TAAVTDEVAVTTAPPVTGEVPISTAAGEAPGRDKDDSDATTKVATEAATVTTTIGAPVEPTTITSPFLVSTAAVTDETVDTTAAPVTGGVTITTAAGEVPGRDKDDADATTPIATETATVATTISASVEPTTIMTSPQPVSTPAVTDEIVATTVDTTDSETTLSPIV
ncbi:Protein SED1 precursor, putative, partial [Perkinsus marinus ATCC 50983]